MPKKNMKSKKSEISARDLMIGLAVKCGGDWIKIYRTIEDRSWMPETEDLKAILDTEKNYLFSDKRGMILTLLDPGYPDALKELARPPFVLFVKDGRISTVPFSQQGIAAIKVPCPKEGKSQSSLWEFDEDGDPVEDPSVAKGTVNIEIEYADLDEQWTQGWGCLHEKLRKIEDSDEAIAKAIDGLKETLADHVREHPNRYKGIKWADFFVRRRDGDDDNPESSDVQRILEGIRNA